jgi:hypothetical protein
MFRGWCCFSRKNKSIPLFLGLYILPDHEHMGAFLLNHFYCKTGDRGCPFQIFYPLCQMQSCIISTALCSVIVYFMMFDILMNHTCLGAGVV